MKINLKQNEIVAALQGYIMQQGISLQGKEVDMAFTAGRKDAGLSVEISIEDSGIPDFGDDEVEALVPVLTVVPSGPIARNHEPENAPEDKDELPEDAPQETKTTSLFG